MYKYKIEIKWAFVFIGMLLLWNITERLLGFHDEYIGEHMYFSMIFVIPAIGLYVLALKEKKTKYYNGQMNFKQGFISGLVITLIVTVFSPITYWVIWKIISPDYFENVIKFSVESGYDSLEDAQAYYNYKNFALQTFIWALIPGIVTSLLAALFVRSKNKTS